ncbi:YcxB family protein [Streptomyces sp. NPDC001393]
MVMDMGRDAGQGVVELAYQPTVDDYTAALRERRRVSKAGRRQRRTAVVALVCGAVGIAIGLTQGHVPLFLMIWFPTFGALLLLSPWLQARQLFRLAERHGAHRVTVTEAGLTMTTQNASTTVNWVARPRYRENKEVFVLFGDDKNAACLTVLPKRGLAGPADVDRLRATLDRNLRRA